MRFTAQKMKKSLMENFFFVCSDWDRVGIKLRKKYVIYQKLAN